MKKKILTFSIIVLGLFGFFCSFTIAKEPSFKKQYTKEIKKFENGVDDGFTYVGGEKGNTVGWSVKNSSVSFFGDSIFTYGGFKIASVFETNVDVNNLLDDNGTIVDSELSDVDDATLGAYVNKDEYIKYDYEHNIDYMSIYLNQELQKEASFDDFDINEFNSYDCYVFGDYLYMVYRKNTTSADEKKYWFAKFDKNLNMVASIGISDSFGLHSTVRQNEDGSFSVFANSYVHFDSDLSLMSDDVCDIVLVDSDLNSVSDVSCIYDNFKEHFPGHENYFAYDNIHDDISVIDNKALIVASDGSFFTYMVDHQEVFSKDAGTNNKYLKAMFFKDMILVLNGKLYNSAINNYIGEIQVYDLEGNLLETISDNSAILDFDVDETNADIVLSSLYVDGLCVISDYLQSGNCNAVSAYNVYHYDDGTGTDVSIPVENPETGDIIIVLFIILFFGALYVYIKSNKKGNLYK